MVLGRIRKYVGNNNPELVMGLAIAVAVFIFYTVFNLIVWNRVSWSYAITFALAAFVAYFIVKRALDFIVTKKEGVIEKRK